MIRHIFLIICPFHLRFQSCWRKVVDSINIFFLLFICSYYSSLFSYNFHLCLLSSSDQTYQKFVYFVDLKKNQCFILLIFIVSLVSMSLTSVLIFILFFFYVLWIYSFLLKYLRLYISLKAWLWLHSTNFDIWCF